MKFFTLVSFLTLALQVHSQPADTTETDARKYFGKNWLTSDSISGLAFEFDDKVADYFLDTLTHTLTLQIRKTSKNGKWLKDKGEVVLFDLLTKKIRWRKSFDFSERFILQHNNFLLETDEDKSYGISLETGQTLWEINNVITYIDPFTPVGLGYVSPGLLTSGTDRLFAVNLKTGRLLWTRPLDNKYGWDDFYHINDTVMVIASSGIHSLNLNTGKGWDYLAATGKDDYTGVIVANLIGLAAGILTGTIDNYVPNTDYSKITSIASNLIEDSTRLYFASRDRIACIDKDSGKVIWSSQLPKEMTGKSTLHMYNHVLYAVGYGYAYMNGEKVKQGHPYVAAFELAGGIKKYFQPLHTEEFVNTLYFRDNNVLIMLGSSILNYALPGGIPVFTQSYNPDSVGRLKYFISDQVYYNNQFAIINMTHTDTTKQYVYTDKSKILILDEQLMMVKQIDYPDPLVAYTTSGSYTFLSQGEKTLIVNRDLKKIAELEVSDQSILVNKTLFCIQGNRLIEIDLGELLPD